MSFPRYPKYKDSGVEWLGAVPEHWEVAPLKRLASFTNGAAFKPTEWAESGYPIIRIENLNGGETFNYFDGEPEDRHLVRDGDLLFGWSGNRGTSFGQYRWRRDEVCVLNQHIFNVASELIEKNDLYWILKAVTAHVEDQAHGIIGMVHVTKGDLGAIKVPVPSFGEQIAISLFLDHETAKIDALIAEQQRLIALLQEKRQAVISHAVTKGLNPDVPMKDSGIEWLGEVPEHWKTGRCRFYVDMLSGFAFPSQGFSNDERNWRLLRGINVGVGSIRWEDSVFWKREPNDGLDAYEMRQGDLVIGMDRPLISDGMRVARLTEQDVPALLLQRVVRLAPLPTLDSEYLQHLLSSEMFVAHFAPETTGVSVPHISPDQIAAFVIPLPPIHEQRAIVKQVRNQIAELTGLVAEAHSAIALLQERRSALISAAVTGQIDVRGLAGSEAA